MKIIPPEKIEELERRKDKFLVEVPTDALNEIYIISNLSEIMHLRAERDWSIESTVPECDRVLGTQNPNYGQLVGLVKKFLKTLSVDSLQKVIDFCSEFMKKCGLATSHPHPHPEISNYSRDIRTADTVDDCFDCMANFAVDQLKKQVAKSKDDALLKTLAQWEN